eukprot:TRINITY_DN1714_c0_g3_i1.p1 TRINITY_DN1714_c0_g3~~TRINITY_DN1714_c0_g3_i1.p1  ORF type:complete len:395 (+),score=75.31 TRINITY_DN1714_c0_g3_i1:51-1235(+)
MSMDQNQVMVPNLDVGEKVVGACNRKDLLECVGTKLLSLAGYEDTSLPPEIKAKLNKLPTMFGRHPLVQLSSGGIEGFCTRVSRTFAALVALKVEQGYAGNINGLWSEELIYVLGELLCYLDDVMSVRVTMVFETCFMSEKIVDDNVDFLQSKLQVKCAKLCNKLDAQDELKNSCFAIYRLFCGSLLCQPFGGEEFLPRLWQLCIKSFNLKPMVTFIAILMGSAHEAILAQYPNNQLKGVVDILQRTLKGFPESHIEEILKECEDAGNVPVRIPVEVPKDEWIILSPQAATIVSSLFPLAYGILPSWALVNGPPPKTLCSRLVQATLIIFVEVCFIAIAISQITSSGENHLDPSSLIVMSSAIALFLNIFPFIPLMLLYGNAPGNQVLEPRGNL